MRIFNQCISIIALEKKGLKYGMTCAWTSQIGYEEMMALIGDQSSTGHIIEIGDIVGINVCSKNCKKIAEHFGDGHSNLEDKFANITYNIDDGAIQLKQSKNYLKCKVVDILHLKGIESDYLVYFKVLEFKENEDEDFLYMGDMD